MPRSFRLSTLLVFIAVLVLAVMGCGGSDTPGEREIATEGYEVSITSSDLAVGKQRFAFVVLRDGELITDKPVYIRFFKIGAGDQATLVGEGSIPWAPLGIETAGADHSGHNDTDVTGVYYVNVDFDTPGRWGVGVSIGGTLLSDREVRTSFQVKGDAESVAVGEPAIPSDNATLKTASLKQIDTSPEPDAQFHELSVAEAITSGKPTVVAFATPSFCASRTCGPVMEVVRTAAGKFGDRINVVHIEPYKLDENGKLITEGGKPRVNAVAANEWRLTSEPFVFVIDKAGTVVARFDGPFSLEELTYAINQVL